VRRWLGLAVIVLAAAIVVLTWRVAARVADAAANAASIHDPATLAEHITVCDRSWHRADVIHPETAAEIRARFGIEPVTVGTSPFAPCPQGPCTNVARDSPCDTVVWVRVGEDAYVAYELQGGP
jgi:hypothetical protein